MVMLLVGVMVGLILGIAFGLVAGAFFAREELRQARALNEASAAMSAIDVDDVQADSPLPFDVVEGR